MNAYRPALDQLRERRKGKPGELTLAIGLVCMLASTLVLAIVHGEGKEFETLKSNGVVSPAQIVSQIQREEGYTDRKGRAKSKTNHYLKISYNLNSSTSYSAWKATGKLAAGQFPAMTMTEIEIPESYLAENPVGSTKAVVLLRGDSSSTALVDQVAYKTSSGYFLKYYAAMAALFAAGLAMTVIGWRKRRAHG